MHFLKKIFSNSALRGNVKKYLDGGQPVNLLKPKYNFAVMKVFNKWKEEFKPQMETEVLVDEEHPFHLIVWNDDVNTFEWVIETLMEICKHSHEQAEQCAYLIHYKGKYSVKEGSYEDLKPMCDAITDRGINATVETVAV